MKQIFTIARQPSSPLITTITTIESFQEDDNHFNLQLSYNNDNNIKNNIITKTSHVLYIS